jgi:hypothetical protein
LLLDDADILSSSLLSLLILHIYCSPPIAQARFLTSSRHGHHLPFVVVSPVYRSHTILHDNVLPLHYLVITAASPSLMEMAIY